MNIVKRLFLFLVLCALCLASCQTIDLYEKTATIPGHKWKSNFKPSFQFTIKDTSSPYQLFITVRHRDRYNYNNLYVNLSTLQPGQDSTQTERYDLKLGSDETGWMGTGMDDIYEHRIPLTPAGSSFYFKKPGEYTFTIEQVMREDPLEDVMNVGIRIEKK
jgi:gliding motility-associated lipoprotein GldH